MDTRTKIIPYRDVPSLLGTEEWTAAVGTFDPLTAKQASRLADFKRTGRKLLVVVLDEEGSLLRSEARAALVAALRDVDAVIVVRADQLSNLSRNRQLTVVLDFEGEKLRTAEFVQFVLRRHGLMQES
ncbi:MAG: hypothetical protein JO033_20765 [Acidobacteriaceae bacterium]|nr:hypothetical protein [Acidobacteriaceae bacterium]MBV9500025.1 hypothetical protein [Acidobacteriaceae bacterium]